MQICHTLFRVLLCYLITRVLCCDRKAKFECWSKAFSHNQCMAQLRSGKGSFIGDHGNGPLPFYLEAPSVAKQNKAHLQIREILFSRYLKQSQKNKANNAELLSCQQNTSYS